MSELSTSSIGAVWPPERASNERIRGFYTDGVIRTADDAAQFADLFAVERQRFEATPSVSRLSIRAIVHAGQLATLHSLGVPVEGALPLANTEDGLCIAYTAVNSPGRRASTEDLASYHALLRQAQARERHVDDAAALLAERGLEARVVNHTQAARLVSDFLPLYSAFGYDEAAVLDLLGNPDNRIVYITDGGHVVSTAMAEIHELPTAELGTLTIAEITEAYTLPTHRQQGLYRCASQLLASSVIAEFGDQLHCLYGEGNLARPGVVFAAVENGRELSHLDPYGTGIPNFGILQQNVAINDGPSIDRYNDFALSYYPL